MTSERQLEAQRDSAMRLAREFERRLTSLQARHAVALAACRELVYGDGTPEAVRRATDYARSVFAMERKETLP